MNIFILNFKNLLLPLIILSLLLIIDMITGVSKGIKFKSFSSSKFKNGFLKMLIYILVNLSCLLIDTLVEFSTNISFFEQYTPIATTVCILISLNEFVSIIENAYVLGLKIPKFLYNILELIEEETGIEYNNDKKGD
jgi:toxin secretion/phage lysis holin